MEVILLEPIKRLGNIGDVVKVKNGYARNFLLPFNKALRATEDNITYFESKKADIKKESDKKFAAAEKIAKKIENAIVAIIMQAGEDGRLYGSVTAANIAHAASEQTKQEIDRKQIILNAPVKYIGVHTIKIALHAELNTAININVARTLGEAEDAAKRFARGEIVLEGPDAKVGKESTVEEAAVKSAEKKAAVSDAAPEAASEITSETEEVKAAAKKKAKKVA